MNSLSQSSRTQSPDIFTSSLQRNTTVCEPALPEPVGALLRQYFDNLKQVREGKCFFYATGRISAALPKTSTAGIASTTQRSHDVRTSSFH